VAFLVGVVLTFVIGQVGLDEQLGLLVGFAPVLGTLWSYTAFHLWPMVLGSSGMGSFLVFVVLPIVILVGSGYWVASGAGRGGGFMKGASVTVGYFVLSLLTFVYIAFIAGNAQVTMEVGVDLVVALVMTGIVFPVVFGGIGGLLADAA